MAFDQQEALEELLKNEDGTLKEGAKEIINSIDSLATNLTTKIGSLESRVKSEKDQGIAQTKKYNAVRDLLTEKFGYTPDAGEITDYIAGLKKEDDPPAAQPNEGLTPDIVKLKQTVQDSQAIIKELQDYKTQSEEEKAVIAEEKRLIKQEKDNEKIKECLQAEMMKDGKYIYYGAAEKIENLLLKGACKVVNDSMGTPQIRFVKPDDADVTIGFQEGFKPYLEKWEKELINNQQPGSGSSPVSQTSVSDREKMLSAIRSARSGSLNF
jgi:hypothetical protein